MTEAAKFYSTSTPTDVPRISVVAASNFTAIASLLKRTDFNAGGQRRGISPTLS